MTTKSIQADKEKSNSVSINCEKTLDSFPGEHTPQLLKNACDKILVLDGCSSVQDEPIFHYEKAASSKALGAGKSGKRILVFSLIHGDEKHAGSVGRLWMERLESIDSRNTWRLVPILNPDGVTKKTRTNANGVDINRNFPTKDWSSTAIKNWESETHRNLRRFPGKESASEPETKCALKHIEDFKPDLIVSIHTPLKVLDFDGPKIDPPKFLPLPWKRLGHFPGSLGRYMWHERKTPVLTMELQEKLPQSMHPFETFQDALGSFLIN